MPMAIAHGGPTQRPLHQSAFWLTAASIYRCAPAPPWR